MRKLQECKLEKMSQQKIKLFLDKNITQYPSTEK